MSRGVLLLPNEPHMTFSSSCVTMPYLFCSSGAPRAAYLWGQPCRSVVGRGLAHTLRSPGATALFLHQYTLRDL